MNIVNAPLKIITSGMEEVISFEPSTIAATATIIGNPVADYRLKATCSFPFFRFENVFVYLSLI